MSRELDMSRLYRYFSEEAAERDILESSFSKDFAFLTKNCGPEYIEYCRISWAANMAGSENEFRLTEMEFRVINGGMPEGFFRKMVEPYADTCEIHTLETDECGRGQG